jgi:hypothetical protein
VLKVILFFFFEFLLELVKLALNVFLKISMKISNNLLAVLNGYAIDQGLESFQLVAEVAHLSDSSEKYLETGSLISLNRLRRGLKRTARPWDFCLILLMLSLR